MPKHERRGRKQKIDYEKIQIYENEEIQGFIEQHFTDVAEKKQIDRNRAAASKL